MGFQNFKKLLSLSFSLPILCIPWLFFSCLEGFLHFSALKEIWGRKGGRRENETGGEVWKSLVNDDLSLMYMQFQLHFLNWVSSTSIYQPCMRILLCVLNWCSVGWKGERGEMKLLNWVEASWPRSSIVPYQRWPVTSSPRPLGRSAKRSLTF